MMDIVPSPIRLFEELPSVLEETEERRRDKRENQRWLCVCVHMCPTHNSMALVRPLCCLQCCVHSLHGWADYDQRKIKRKKKGKMLKMSYFCFFFLFKKKFLDSDIYLSYKLHKYRIVEMS